MLYVRLSQELGGMLPLERRGGGGLRLLYKRGNKRNVPSIFTKSSPCPVGFLLQCLGKATGQLCISMCHVPSCFSGASYKLRLSLAGF